MVQMSFVIPEIRGIMNLKSIKHQQQLQQLQQQPVLYFKDCIKHPLKLSHYYTCTTTSRWEVIKIHNVCKNTQRSHISHNTGEYQL